MKHSFLLIVLALSACVETSTPTESQGKTIEEVSIVQLISNPEEFDGATVRVMGYVQLEFETYVLWLHREDRVHGLLPNRIDLEASACEKNIEQVNERYAILEGTFTAINKGTDRERRILHNITRCQFWTDAK